METLLGAHAHVYLGMFMHTHMHAMCICVCRFYYVPEHDGWHGMSWWMPAFCSI